MKIQWLSAYLFYQWNELVKQFKKKTIQFGGINDTLYMPINGKFLGQTELLVKLDPVM